METPQNSKQNTKSRKGCSQCKKKRVKCDETKPVCLRCQKARNNSNGGEGGGEGCDYGLKLSWTQGRPFKKRKIDVPVEGSGKDSMSGGAEGGMVSNAFETRSAYSKHRTRGVNKGESVLDRVEGTGDMVVFGGASGMSGPWIDQTNHVVSPGNAEPNTSDSEVHQDGVILPSPSQSSRFADAPDDDSLEVVHTSHSITTNINTPDTLDDAADYDITRAQETTPDIPPTLSSYPLLCPSEGPNAYFFLHHYSIHTATTLFPLLPAAARDSLLSVAATSPHLLSALLAISADQYARLRGDYSPNVLNRALFFKSKALIGLQSAMNDPISATSFATISTALALCTSDILMPSIGAGGGHNQPSQNWKTHLRGAERLLTLALGSRSHSTSSPTTDPSKLFLIKWFAAMDMFVGVSSLQKTLVPDGRYWSIVGVPTLDGSPQPIDDFVGFSLELMPLLSRISRMARLQQSKSALTSSLDSSSSQAAEIAQDLDALLADNAAHTETELLSLFSRVFPTTLLDPIRAKEAQLAHQLFVYASLLHLYRRVQELPKQDPKVEFVTASIIEIIALLPPDSPASIVILWPLFSTGCETDDLGRRAVVLERMRDLRRYGMGNVDQAIEALEAFWESQKEVGGEGRGEGDGVVGREREKERWDVFLRRRGWDMVLF